MADKQCFYVPLGQLRRRASLEFFYDIPTQLDVASSKCYFAYSLNHFWVLLINYDIEIMDIIILIDFNSSMLILCQEVRESRSLYVPIYIFCLDVS